MDAMLDPNTALLRLHWISGLHMLGDNPITGVGLDNFGIAYPHYQILGAGDVKPAHNDYLQMASETGIFGLLAFLAFWGYFIVHNGRSILREEDRATRWFRAGVFAGVVGFLLHSFVDFNFYNPDLATVAFIFRGHYVCITSGKWRRPHVARQARGRSVVRTNRLDTLRGHAHFQCG